MARMIDADTLKGSIQGHYSVIEQDCAIGAKFADGAIAGLDAAMYEVADAPFSRSGAEDMAEGTGGEP